MLSCLAFSFGQLFRNSLFFLLSSFLGWRIPCFVSPVDGFLRFLLYPIEVSGHNLAVSEFVYLILSFTLADILFWFSINDFFNSDVITFFLFFYLNFDFLSFLAKNIHFLVSEAKFIWEKQSLWDLLLIDGLELDGWWFVIYWMEIFHWRCLYTVIVIANGADPFMYFLNRLWQRFGIPTDIRAIRTLIFRHICLILSKYLLRDMLFYLSISILFFIFGSQTILIFPFDDFSLYAIYFRFSVDNPRLWAIFLPLFSNISTLFPLVVIFYDILEQTDNHFLFICFWFVMIWIRQAFPLYFWQFISLVGFILVDLFFWTFFMILLLVLIRLCFHLIIMILDGYFKSSKGTLREIVSFG